MGSQVRALLFPPQLPGSVVQLVRTPACHAGGRGFKSLPSRHLLSFEKERKQRKFQIGFPVCAFEKERFASVAQLVEQRTENPRVVGSIPTGGTNLKSPGRTSSSRQHASVAHLVERHLAKVEVASSSLVTRSIFMEQFLLQMVP